MSSESGRNSSTGTSDPRGWGAGEQVVTRVVAGRPKLQTAFSSWEGDLPESLCLAALDTLGAIFLLSAEYLE